MFTNELIHETSPYLLQHAHNPVRWMPWGEAAFEKAKREDKPIFLSVGYSTCHWCHVMAHESFENEEVARILNKHFVSIKVDREELPDVDEQYMLASQLITRRGGGWPNSVWLTPEKKPWFAGTYFPREDRGEMPGFKTMLLQLADTWENNRAQIEAMADQMTEVLREVTSQSKDAAERRPLGPGILNVAVREAGESFDKRHGGFGHRPKFPPHATLALLVDRYRKSYDPALLEMITETLEAMSLGGVYDHVGGGFHRYSTDERWFLPHFEKMLYDNGQLIRLYADACVLTGREDFEHVVRETVGWVKREMTDPAGGFYSALDADSLNSEGHAEEGRFYVWTPAQVIHAIGKADGKFFNMVYGITKEGNFEEEATGRRTGDSVPYLAMSVDDVAMGMKFEATELRERLEQMQRSLLVHRMKRSRPHLDDKVLAGWNGLMIEGLAHAGRVLDEEEYIDMAARAADFVLKKMRDKTEGRLLRTWRDGEAKLPAYLTDYAFFTQGLLELYQATGEEKWLEAAMDLAELMLDDFSDPVRGGFFFTSEQHDPLLTRSTGITGGGNIPSGNAVAARVLTRLAVLTGEVRYVTAAEGVFDAHDQAIWERPAQHEDLILAWAEYFDAQEEGELPELQGEADATAGEAPVRLAAYVAHDQVKPGENFTVKVEIQVDEPWHIYSDQPGSNIPVKTELTLDETKRATLESVRYPEPVSIKDAVTGETLNMFTGRVVLEATVRLHDDEVNRSGESVALTLRLKAQACDAERCLLSKTYALPIRVFLIGAFAPLG